MTLSNSLLSSAVIAVIIVIVLGYVISYSVGMDTVADIVFTGMLDAAYAVHEVLSLTPTASITDGGRLELSGARDITTFKSDGHIYAVVVARDDNGVQILDITNPSNIHAAGSTAGINSLGLNKAQDIAIFESGDHIYAAVTAPFDSSVQILDITNPSNIHAAGSVSNGGDFKLTAAWGIATFKSGNHTYAAVTAPGVNSVQILNITDLDDITATYSKTDGGSLELSGAEGITTFKSGNHTYVAVAANGDDGVQILNVTDPTDITTTKSIPNSNSLKLSGAAQITTFESGGHIYVAVTAQFDDAVQILNVTDPPNTSGAGSIVDKNDLKLDGAVGITTFKSGNHTYVAVAANDDDGVQILNVTDLPTITPVGSIANNDNLELDGAYGITTFESGGYLYAAVAAFNDDGVQIIGIDIPETTPPVMNLTGPSLVTITVGDPYEEQGATCMDVHDDGDISVTYSGTVDIHRIGAYTVTYHCADAAGNDAVWLSRTIIVQLIATDNIGNDDNLELDTPRGIAIFESGNRTYAAVAALDDDGVQILDVTNPYGIIPAGNITDTDNLELDGAVGITAFKSGGRIYVAVTAVDDAGVQILDVTDPPTIIPAGNIAYLVGEGKPELDINSVWGITTFKSGDYLYAAVAGNTGDGVQILNVTDPYNIIPTDSIKDGDDDGKVHLNRARDITTFESDGSIYAAVAAGKRDDGVQILDVTDPTDIDAVIYLPDAGHLRLNNAAGIATFKSGDHTYIVVASLDNSAVQILDVTNPLDPLNIGFIEDNIVLKLKNARGITIFESGGHTYAAVAASGDDGVQILDVTDPSNIIAAGSITDTDNLKLDGAAGIATFKSGNHTYAAVIAANDKGVQIIRVDIPVPDTTPAIYLLGDNSVTIPVGAEYDDAGAICTGNIDVILEPLSMSPVNTTEAGEYTVTYSCADTGNPDIQMSKMVTVQASLVVDDNESPVIYLLGADPVTIPVGTQYEDAGAICTDNIDAIRILTSTSTVNATQAGEYTVTYSCADMANNPAEPVSREVIVQASSVVDDTKPPVIYILGADPVTIPVGTQYEDKGAICTDNIDAIRELTSTSTVNATQTGEYTVTYSCTDMANNPAEPVSREVIVQASSVVDDTKPPVIYILGANPVTISVGTQYEDKGAICTDNIDAIRELTSTSTVDTTQAETYTVTYSCTDMANNPAEPVSREVIVQASPSVVIPGNTPPVILNPDSPSQGRSNSAPQLLAVDNNMIIDGQSYGLGNGTVTIKPSGITTGQSTDIVFTAYSAKDIIHFTVYLNLHGDDIGHNDSDTYVSYDHGVVKIRDPHGFISDASITITEGGIKSSKKIISTLIEFDGKMGLTNMVVYMWNGDRRPELIKVFDALDVMSGLPDPEPGLPDPEPQILPDPEPQIYNGTAATTPSDTELSDAETLSIIRIWAGFEQGTVTDDELLQALNLDYHDNHIPNWVMTELGPLAAKNLITVEQFRTALQYVLTHA